MAKKRSKKSKQQKRQAASARQQQRRSERQQETVAEPEIAVGDLTPGDRINLMLGEMGRVLDTKPFPARLVAMMIDYFLCGLVTMLPLMAAINMAGDQDIASLSQLAAAGVGLPVVTLVLASSLLMSFLYYVIIPLKLMPGQTPGKRVTHQEVVMLDGSPATMGALSIRWAVLIFVETLASFASAMVLQYVTLLGGEMVGNAYTGVGAALTVVSGWFVWTKAPARRALHDLAAGTWVYNRNVTDQRGRAKGKRAR